MHLSIFDIPHLKEDITQYLANRDLVQCTLVSKEWYGYFSPVLWQHPLSGHDFYDEDIMNFLRHKDYIRSIESSRLRGEGAVALILQSSFPILKHLQIAVFNSSHLVHGSKVLSFIEMSTSLQFLDLSLEDYQDQLHKRLVDVLRSHPNLRGLSFACPSQTNPFHIQEIIQVSSRFTSFKLDLSANRHLLVETEGSFKNMMAAKDRIALMKNTKIQNLFILTAQESQDLAFLIPLLGRCPLLEKLTLDRPRKNAIIGITEVLKGGQCPLLKEIETNHLVYYGSQIFEDLMCSVGQSSKVEGGNGEIRKGGLETYIQSSGKEIWNPVFKPCHAQTLTRLELPLGTMPDVSVWTGILTGLPRLQRLSMSIGLFPVTDFSERAEIFHKQWACGDMRDLTLGFTIPYDLKSVRDSSWEGSQVNKWLIWIFSQVGQLTNLRSLELHGGRDFLSIQCAPYYPFWLYNLKQLRKLRFQCGLPDLMGCTEATWMATNWSKLIEVVVFVDSSISVEELASFERTLKAARPWLVCKIEGRLIPAAISFPQYTYIPY